MNSRHKYLAAFLCGVLAVLAPGGAFTGHVPSSSELGGAAFAGALAVAMLFLKSPEAPQASDEPKAGGDPPK